MGPRRRLPPEVTRYRGRKVSLDGTVKGWVSTPRFREINDPTKTSRTNQSPIVRDYDPRQHAYTTPTLYNSTPPDLIQHESTSPAGGHGNIAAGRPLAPDQRFVPPDQITYEIDHEQATWLMHRFFNERQRQPRERPTPLDNPVFWGGSIGPTIIGPLSGENPVDRIWSDVLSRPTYDACALTHEQFQEAASARNCGTAEQAEGIESPIDQLWNDVVNRPTYDGLGFSDGPFHGAMTADGISFDAPTQDAGTIVGESHFDHQPAEDFNSGFASAAVSDTGTTLDQRVAQVFSTAPDEISDHATGAVAPDIPLEAIVEDEWMRDPWNMMGAYGMPPPPGMMPGMPMQMMDPFMMGPFGGPMMGPMM